MKILLIGATGTLGKAIIQHLGMRHDIVKVGHSSGQFNVDIGSQSSIQALFEQVGKVDAIVSVTGKVHFGPLADMTGADFNLGLQNKLLGQVNLALIGQHFLNPKGSITLTTGIINEQPILSGANAASVNGGIEAFVKAAAVELDKGIRINVVSPSVVTESLAKYDTFFPGFESVSAQRVAKAFQRSIEGPLTGHIYKVW